MFRKHAKTTFLLPQNEACKSLKIFNLGAWKNSTNFSGCEIKFHKHVKIKKFSKVLNASKVIGFQRVKRMITPKNIFRHELVGLFVKVVNSTHEGFTGIEGKVVDETKNTILIETDKTEKIVPKGVATFHFYLPDGNVVEIEGKIIIARPEDRIKKKFRKFW